MSRGGLPGIFHNTALARSREWLGLVLVRRWLQQVQGMDVTDVHHTSREADLLTSIGSIDLKVDFYFGADHKSEYHRKRTDCVALETVSNDHTGAMGWMVTSRVDYILYYFLSLNNHADDIEQWVLTKNEERYLQCMDVHDDALLILPTTALQSWFWENRRYLGYRQVEIPNADPSGRTYDTWVRLVPIEDVLHVPGVRVVDRISRAVTSTLQSSPPPSC